MLVLLIHYKKQAFSGCLGTSRCMGRIISKSRGLHGFPVVNKKTKLPVRGNLHMQSVEINRENRK